MRIQIKLKSDFVVRINTSANHMTTTIDFHPIIRENKETLKFHKPSIIGVSPKFVTENLKRPDCLMRMSDFSEMVYAVECASSRDVDATELDINQDDMIPWDRVRGIFYVLDEGSHIMVRRGIVNGDTWANVSVPLITEDGFVSMNEWIVPRIAFDVTTTDQEQAHGAAIASLYQTVQLISSYRLIQTYAKDPETGHPCIIRTYVDGNGHTMTVITIAPKFIKMECRSYNNTWVTHQYYIADQLSVAEIAEKDSFTLKTVHSRNESPRKAFKVDALWSNIIRKEWAYENTNRS